MVTDRINLSILTAIAMVLAGAASAHAQCWNCDGNTASGTCNDGHITGLNECEDVAGCHLYGGYCEDDGGGEGEPVHPQGLNDVESTSDYRYASARVHFRDLVPVESLIVFSTILARGHTPVCRPKVSPFELTARTRGSLDLVEPLRSLRG